MSFYFRIPKHPKYTNREFFHILITNVTCQFTLEFIFSYKTLHIQNISTESFPFFDLHTWVYTRVYFNNATGTDNSRSGGPAGGYQSLSRARAREECGVLERHNHHRQWWAVSTQEAGFQSERYNVSIRQLQYR